MEKNIIKIENEIVESFKDYGNVKRLHMIEKIFEAIEGFAERARDYEVRKNDNYSIFVSAFLNEPSGNKLSLFVSSGVSSSCVNLNPSVQREIKEIFDKYEHKSTWKGDFEDASKLSKTIQITLEANGIDELCQMARESISRLLDENTPDGKIFCEINRILENQAIKSKEMLKSIRRKI